MSQSIFDRYGGFAKISRVVSDFYGLMMESENLAPYFQGIDIPRLIDHQTKFIASLMGGPASYTPDQIQRAHTRFGISSKDFDESANLLAETLEDHDFEESDISSVIAEFQRFKRSIVRDGGAE